MALFQSYYATKLFAIMHEYVITGRDQSLPLISEMISEDLTRFFNEPDNQGNTLFYHLLNLPLLALADKQTLVRSNLLQTLFAAKVNPICAIMHKKPELVNTTLQLLLKATQEQIISHNKLLRLLTSTDIDGKTPIEVAIETRDQGILRLYFSTIQLVMPPPDLFLFFITPVHLGANLLEHIEFYADVQMLFAYIDCLYKAVGPFIAFSLLYQQAMNNSTEREALISFDNNGNNLINREAPASFVKNENNFLNTAIAILQTIDSVEIKWQQLATLRNKIVNLPKNQLGSGFNFRLFSSLPFFSKQKTAETDLDRKTVESLLPKKLLEMDNLNEVVTPRRY